MSRTNAGLMAVLSEFGASLTKQASIGDEASGGTSPAKTGARFSENTKDVKAQEPVGVEGAPENANDGKSKGTSNPLGVGRGFTGENVPSTKTKKDDPPTTLKGESTAEKTAGFDGDFGGLANDIMAGIAVATHQVKQAAAAPAAPAVTQVEKQAENAPTREELGYLAAQFTDQLTKQAQTAEQQNYAQQLEQHAQQQLRGVLEKAALHADYLSQYLQGREKAAMGGMGGEVTDPNALMAGGASPGGMGGDPAGLGAAAGGGAPGGDPTGGVGGPPPGGDPTGGDPTGGAGGLDPAILQMAAMLVQAGVTPEEAAKALSGGAPGGGGAPPDASGGGSDAGAAAAAEEGGSDNKGKEGKEGAEKTAQFAPITPAMLKMAGAIATAVEAQRSKKGK